MTETARQHEVIRPDDGELVGYVRQQPPGSGRWQPLAVFGSPLAEPRGYASAVELLCAHGLAWLAEPWQVYSAEHGWQACHLQEAAPGRVVVLVGELARYGMGERRRVTEPDRALRPARTPG